MTIPSILVVDDEPEIRNAVKDIFEDEGFSVMVAENADEARQMRMTQTPDLVLLDIWMPGEDGVSLLKDWKEREGLAFPVIMMSGHGTVETAVEATRLGAFDFIEKPVSLAKLLRVTSQALESHRNENTTQPPQPPVPLLEPVGESREMEIMRYECKRAAKHNTNVLLLGEPGSGKTFAARYIHASSENAANPFVVANCGAFSDSSGDNDQSDQAGFAELLEQQASGTLYIAELADLDSTMQAMLFKLVEGQDDAVTSGKTPIRLMVASQFDLKSRVDDGSLREDLYYRLNVFPIKVPPLRDHAEDVPELLRFYVDYFNTQENLPYRHFTLPAQNYLRYYSWPGNIRQLRNLVQRMLILSDTPEINQWEVEDTLVRDRVAQAQLTAGLPKEVMELPLREAREIFEREYLSRQLELCRGNVSRLAERVGMERTHLYRKMRALDISPKKN